MQLNSITRRLLALLLGTVLAAGSVVGGVAVLYPTFLPEVAPNVLPGWAYDSTIPLSSPQEGSECPPVADIMHVIRGRHDQQWNLTQREISDDRRTIHVEFVGLRGEKRILMITVGEHRATVRARYDACGFEWWRSIHAAGSHAHVHPDQVCLDLSVSQPGDSPERWTAQISMR